MTMRFIFLLFFLASLNVFASGGASLGGSGNATSLQGTPVSVTAPSGTQCLVSSAGTWGPGSCSSGSGGISGSWSSTTGNVVTTDGADTAQDSGTTLASLAPKASPTFTGTVTLPTTAGYVKSSSGGVLSSGSIANADLPNPTTSALGGVRAINAVTSEWITSISTSGIPSLSQPAFSDISGTASLTSQVTGTLPVANGGTGDSTLTAYAILAGGTTSTGVLQQVSGLGSSGDVLTSNGSGALPTWQAGGGGGGGANTALSNLSSVAINTSLLPATTNTIGLGTATDRFENGFISGNLCVGTNNQAITNQPGNFPVGYGAFGTNTQRDSIIGTGGAAGDMVGWLDGTYGYQGFYNLGSDIMVIGTGGSASTVGIQVNMGVKKVQIPIGATGVLGGTWASGYVTTTPVSNSGTGATLLTAVQFPAGVLNNVGDRVVFEQTGIFASNANPKEITVAFGVNPGTTIYDSGSLVLNGGVWDVTCIVTMVSSSAQNYVCKAATTATVGTIPTMSAGALSLTSASSAYFAAFGTGGATNDITSNQLNVDFLSAP